MAPLLFGRFRNRTTKAFFSSWKSVAKMVSCRTWITVVSAALLAAVCVSGDHLSEFLPPPDGEESFEIGLEEHVRRIRNVVFQRVRCGAQQGIPQKLCQDCLSTERILEIARRSDGTLQNLGRVSVVLLNYLLSFQTSCTVESVRLGYVGSCRVYDQCWSEVHTYLAPSNSLVENLEKILREVKAVFEPDPSKRCFSAEMLVDELNPRPKRLQALSADVATVLLVTSHLYSGECIDVGESVADFLDDIFLHYGDGCERVMTQSGFTKLWNDLQMQQKGKHIDHGMQKSSCSSTSPESSRSSITQMHASSGDTYTKQPSITDRTLDYSANGTLHVSAVSDKFQDKSTTTIWTTINRGPVSTSDLDIENSTVVLLANGNAPKTTNNSDLYLVGEGSAAKENVEIVTGDTWMVSRRSRHAPFDSDHEHKNLANECLPSDDLLQRFLTSGNQVITSSEFLQLCPALVQQAVSGVCSARVKASAVDMPMANRTTDVFQKVTSQNTNPWFAVAAVALITAVSFMGLFLLPVLKKSFFVHINAFFTGLAFGTMSGDVVLHLMPQYLGLHQHDENDHSHEETAFEMVFPSHLQRQLVFLLTMYLLFLVECIFSIFTGENKENHGHSHGPLEISLRDLDAAGDIEDGKMKPITSPCMRVVEFLRPSIFFSGISSKAAIIILADTVHNFADGMAIAVGFSTSYKDGFSTSIAVFFHELPHEIGDFAVLMNCGLSYWKAFAFNILSGLSAFIGLGVGVFTATVWREWLLCITAGLFFFVVMVEMLPDMRLESKEKWREFAVKITGTVFGIFTMICIAMYELSSA